MQLRSKALVCSVFVLTACASWRGKSGSPDNEPTLKTLASKKVSVDKGQNVETSEAQAIKAYKQFLDIAPNAPQRAEALRRIGDLEMDSADKGSADPKVIADPDYSVAITRYQEFLRLYPKDPNNDRVLYQLARAQEQNGKLEVALQTLNRLVRDYPQTSYYEEAQFRRGELLFTARDYTNAEKAYATVLKEDIGQYHDRALYMRGWSQFKQGKLEDGLQSFFGVLDAKLAKLPNGADEASLESIADLSRADRELVEDTFRVTSLSLTNLGGAESIPEFMTSTERRSYEFRVYEQLGELYLKQDRVKDAADTFGLFARRKPLDAQAPLLQTRVIDIYERNGFANLALDAKKEYVARYGIKSEFRQANPEGWKKAQVLVKLHLAELARHYHASGQKNKSPSDLQEATRWYREFIVSFPTDPQAAQSNFLLAELLYDDGKFAEASVEYEKTAYGYPQHAKSADAGYTALLSYAKQKKSAPQAEQAALDQISIASALRFAQSFNSDQRVAPVLADTAEKLYALKDAEQAESVAQQILAREPKAGDEQRRVAWTILAYTTFERNAFALSENAFGEVLKLTPQTAPNRAELIERQAATIYKQGELARSAGALNDAVGHFERVAVVAPLSTVRANAQFDAAATLIAQKKWVAAANSLEDFRTRYPKHPLQAKVGDMLAVTYLEKEQWADAAQEFERIAANNKDPKLARDVLWQAAELYEKAGSRTAATKAYERYLSQNASSLEYSLEARARLAKLAREEGNTARELMLTKEIFAADRNGGAARTARTRFLAANAALTLAEPVADAYRKVVLNEPLQKQLKLKKSKMEEALKAYSVATDFGVAEVTTAATYRIATIYRDFGKALMASERPKKLKKVEREQYDVLLEEQAFPFEEKAIELHELNVQRTSQGLYDSWIKNSFDALRELKPIRYGKAERIEGGTDAIR